MEGHMLASLFLGLFYILGAAASLECSGLLTEAVGEMKSPGYPDAYPANVDCRWIIEAPPTRKIILSFNDFFIEDTVFCTHGDYLVVSEPGYDNYVFCGRDHPRTIESVGNALDINFVSDGDDQHGFRFSLTYITVSKCEDGWEEFELMYDDKVYLYQTPSGEFKTLPYVHYRIPEVVEGNEGEENCDNYGFSRFVRAFALKDKSKEEVANAMERIFREVPGYKKLHVDYGRQFYNRTMDALLNKFRIERETAILGDYSLDPLKTEHAFCNNVSVTIDGITMYSVNLDTETNAVTQPYLVTLDAVGNANMELDFKSYGTRRFMICFDLSSNHSVPDRHDLAHSEQPFFRTGHLKLGFYGDTFERFVSEHGGKSVVYNDVQVQSSRAKTCGVHVIFYLIRRCLGHSVKEMIMYIIRVHSAEERDDALVLLSVLAHVKLEATSPHTIVLRLEGENRLRRKTIEEKLGSLRLSLRQKQIPGDGWLLGDSGYPQRSYRMINPKTKEEVAYNNCHARARSIVERAIGSLKARFRSPSRTIGTTIRQSQESLASMLNYKPEKTLVDWRDFIRELLYRQLENLPPIGGPEQVVQIDESYFRGRRKNNKGRFMVESLSFLCGKTRSENLASHHPEAYSARSHDPIGRVGGVLGRPSKSAGTPSGTYPNTQRMGGS
ncbi:unnamed protein product [Darwinula stevensoni]|uniref:CUB domain-containing protein n=1 Tax=Darwinula stevensoni TaxID=69355 RepID=A0A7R9A8K8_9CRUS|nr:unnamed protein product [Darwinula stevensoni]CAG0896455.1 unnamed protein product [Darwinula stevensoni]